MSGKGAEARKGWRSRKVKGIGTLSLEEPRDNYRWLMLCIREEQKQRVDVVDGVGATSTWEGCMNRKRNAARGREKRSGWERGAQGEQEQEQEQEQDEG
eukprot:759683-Hanusia_phi.AAC.9